MVISSSGMDREAFFVRLSKNTDESVSLGRFFLLLMDSAVY
jgi:hypothetical protein